MNGTPIEYHKLLKAVAPSLARTRKKACEPESLAFEYVDFNKFGQMAVSEQVSDAHGQAFRAGKRRDRAPVASALEGDRWARQSNALEAMDDMGGFRLLASQELPASRKIVEEVAYFNLRSRRSTNLPHRLDLAT
jgi:hypothetical protein